MDVPSESPEPVARGFSLKDASKLRKPPKDFALGDNALDFQNRLIAHDPVWSSDERVKE